MSPASLLRVRSPFSGELVAELPYDDPPSLERKLAAAQAAFGRWRRAPLSNRCALVARGLEHFRREAEAIARDLTRQMGKPVREARNEVKTCLARAEHMLAIAPAVLAGEALEPLAGFHRRIEHAPLGVVLNIAAWNYPLLIPVNVVVPALLAGNTVLLKHSGRTPLAGLHFERAFSGLGESGLVANLVLTHETTAQLARDPRVAHLAFTGSVEGGRQVAQAAAGRFIDVGLELGGKDPAYVAADADLDFAAENVVDGACYNAGQSCCAVERVYVHERVALPFLEKARAVVARYVLGDPMAETTTLGPLVSEAAVATVERQVDDARRRGARILAGGERPRGLPGSFYAPTLLAGVPEGAEVLAEETFGPLLPVQAVPSDDEAIARCNQSRYGLTASIWTRDRERAERFAREVEAGTIYMNRCDNLDPALPWTGWRDSGRGSTLSRYGFYHLTRRKSIHFRLGR
jgi:acyl-CoA reductase-like NAD-dependent aldehyde dehydrogenase